MMETQRGKILLNIFTLVCTPHHCTTVLCLIAIYITQDQSAEYIDKKRVWEMERENKRNIIVCCCWGGGGSTIVFVDLCCC